MILIYLISILGGFAWGITELINKNIIEDKYSTFAYAFLQYFFNFLIFLIPSLFLIKLPAPGTAYLFLIGTIIIFLIGNALNIQAYKTEDISNVSILGNANLIVYVILGTLILAEPFTIPNLLGLILIFIGITVIFYQGKKLKVSTGLFFALAAGIIWGFRPLFDKFALSSFHIILYILLTNGCLAAVMFLLPRVRKDVPKIWKKYKSKILISRITASLGFLFVYWSVANGQISIVSTNSSVSFLLSITLIGIIVLKEKKNIPHKLAGSALCTLGIILLNFF